MNELFVNIKVDKEERPDIDKVYMNYVQAVTGSGGWPMSVWLTPSLHPITGGTYFPPVAKYGRLGFAEICRKVGELWKESKEEILEQSSQIMEELKQAISRGSSEGAEVEREEALVENERREERIDRSELRKFGYEVESNPFNDPSLDKKFVWKAKQEAGGKEEKKREEQLRELEKLRQRRSERELEKQVWEEERMKMDLDKDGYSFKEWKQKEHQFHLSQARQRSELRIKGGRPKPIDLLYVVINPEIEADFELAEPAKVTSLSQKKWKTSFLIYLVLIYFFLIKGC